MLLRSAFGHVLHQAKEYSLAAERHKRVERTVVLSYVTLEGIHYHIASISLSSGPHKLLARLPAG